MTQQGQATVRLTLAQALVRYLTVQFSERDGQSQRLIPRMFGIFGHGNVGVAEALRGQARDLPYAQVRNEQSMVHAAAGFAKSCQRLATFACTASIGPGSTNMVTGAAGATINHLPVLLLPGDTCATRAQGVVMQQLQHALSGDISVNDCLRPVSRFFDRITRPEQLLTALPEAMRVLTSPVEAGAVTLALPEDVQAHSCDYPASFFQPHTWRVGRPVPEPARVAEAAALISRSRHPVIIAGGGLLYSGAEAALSAFAERLELPVAETFAGKGAMQRDSWLALGGIGTHGNRAAAQVVREADLVVCVGTRLTDVTTGSQTLFANPDVRFIGVNVSDQDACKQGALPIVADAREALRALDAATEGMRPPGGDTHRAAVTQAKLRWQDVRGDAIKAVPGEGITQAQAIGVLNEVAQPGDTVVAAAGLPPGDLLGLWDASGERHCHLEYGYSCMGYEIPAAIGVRLGQPEGEVYALIGDGTFLMNPSELLTAVQEGLKVTVLIIDNHGFQSVQRVSMSRIGSRFGNEFRFRDEDSGTLDGAVVPLDLGSVCRGLGAQVFPAASADDLRAALDAARSKTETSVIVVPTQMYEYAPSSTVWWDIEPPEVSEDPTTRLLRAEYENDRMEQRFHG